MVSIYLQAFLTSFHEISIHTQKLFFRTVLNFCSNVVSEFINSVRVVSIDSMSTHYIIEINKMMCMILLIKVYENLIHCWIPVAERGQATYPPLPGTKMFETPCSIWLSGLQFAGSRDSEWSRTRRPGFDFQQGSSTFPFFAASTTDLEWVRGLFPRG
jgi:hypothetical protein